MRNIILNIKLNLIYKIYDYNLINRSMKNNDTKRIYINLSNISKGWFIQVAMSFIDHFVNSDINHNFYFFIFKSAICEINNSHLAPYLNQISYKTVSKYSMFFYFSIMQPKNIYFIWSIILY